MAEWKRISVVYRQVKKSTNNRRKQGYSTLQGSDQSVDEWYSVMNQICIGQGNNARTFVEYHFNETKKRWNACLFWGGGQDLNYRWRWGKIFLWKLPFQSTQNKIHITEKRLLNYIFDLYFQFYYSVKNFSFGEKHLFEWCLKRFTNLKIFGLYRLTKQYN